MGGAHAPTAHPLATPMVKPATSWSLVLRAKSCVKKMTHPPTSLLAVWLKRLSQLRTVRREVVPRNTRFFGLENLDEKDVELHAFETHPRERRQEEIVQKAGHDCTEHLQRQPRNV